ncbi:uncharacterized protein LOC142541447 [Primulina tabacum]|uniref:uncharacterized protein LOC142541447 n=1 Tax=Primulina tabacum TaxID=48773 RepID=UPI003F596D50
MNKGRANSSPELVPPPLNMEQQYDDSALEGVAANVKLLLKLIQDHKNACDKDKNDSRRMLRVATMMTILDSVRSRIQKCQSIGNKRSEAELRRCNTDVGRNSIPRDTKNGNEPVDDEKERLKRELNSSLATQKSLSVMCTGLGKEREIMATQLSLKVHELSEMEDLINELKKQNERLLDKVRGCASEQKEKRLFDGMGRGESQGNVALQERNKELSEQLLKSLEGYRSIKKKLREAQEENMVMHSTIDEMGAKVITSIEKFRCFKERTSLSSRDYVSDNIREEIVALEGIFHHFQECVKLKGLA